MKTFCLLISFLFVFSCREKGERVAPTSLSDKIGFGLLSDKDCLIESLRISFKGVVEDEMVALDRESPLRYENMKCEGGFFLKLGSERILLEKAVFSKSELALRESVLELKNLSLRTSEIEGIGLEKAGLCIKNFETKKNCKDRSKGGQCLFYDSYEEEIYKIFSLRIEANGVEIYSSTLDLIFNREYELKWSDEDLLSAFWTKLHNCSD